MKQIESDKYSVAWFKLADCIARGEKERALGVYRLLSYSLGDSALARQLQADILLSFGDDQAYEKYRQAAMLYEEQERFLEAAAVYEHLVTLQSDHFAYRVRIIDLYQQLAIGSKVTQYVGQLVEHLLQKDEWKKAIEIIERYPMDGDPDFTASLHERMLFYLVTIENVLPDTVMVHAHKAIDALLELEKVRAIDTLLAKLQAVDEKMYEYAVRYRESKEK